MFIQCTQCTQCTCDTILVSSQIALYSSYSELTVSIHIGAWYNLKHKHGRLLKFRVHLRPPPPVSTDFLCLWTLLCHSWPFSLNFLRYDSFYHSPYTENIDFMIYQIFLVHTKISCLDHEDLTPHYPHSEPQQHFCWTHMAQGTVDLCAMYRSHSPP